MSWRRNMILSCAIALVGCAGTAEHPNSVGDTHTDTHSSKFLGDISSQVQDDDLLVAQARLNNQLLHECRNNKLENCTGNASDLTKQDRETRCQKEADLCGSGPVVCVTLNGELLINSATRWTIDEAEIRFSMVPDRSVAADGTTTYSDTTGLPSNTLIVLCTMLVPNKAPDGSNVDEPK